MHVAACDGHMLEQWKAVLSRRSTLHLLQQQNKWTLLRSGNFRVIHWISCYPIHSDEWICLNVHTSAFVFQ